jgi:methionyl-tRNA formyltransferase
MNRSKGILILMGYDYVHALRNHVSDPDVYVLITKGNTQYFLPESLDILRKLMGERLLISESTKADIFGLKNLGLFDCLLTLGWRKLIDVNEFGMFSQLINVHPALLPEYKGYHPVPYVLLNNERKHGITAHCITNEMDSGDIILRKEFAINTFSTLTSLQYLVKSEMPKFLTELFDIIRKGNQMLSANNDGDTKIRAPKRAPEDSRINLDDTVEQMFLIVKASDSERFPAYFVMEGEKVYIRLFREQTASRQTQFDI